MKTKHTSKKNIYLPRVDSTNRELFRIKDSKSLPEGTVLWTDEQYSGKGMGSSTWESEKGLNITASFLLFPEFLEPENQFYLNKAISLSVCDTVADILKDEFRTEIKWPNDILVNENKIAGILIENIIQGSMLKCTVAGIGINMNQTLFGDYPIKPTSVKLLTGKRFVVTEAIDILSGHLQQRYKALKNDNTKLLDEDYLNKLYRFQKAANYRANFKSFKGKICGIDKFGKLLLETSKGNIKAYDFKEVQFID